MSVLTVRTFEALRTTLNQLVTEGADLSLSRWFPNGTDHVSAESFDHDFFLDPPDNIPGGRIGMGEEPEGREKPSLAGGANVFHVPTLEDLRVKLNEIAAQPGANLNVRCFASGVELLAAQSRPWAFRGDVAGSLRAAGGRAGR